jgi:outer membrane protein assembly factor BamD (BamD/ComL family)
MGCFYWLSILLAATGADSRPAERPGQNLYYQALQSARAGEVDKALKRLQQILDEHPEDTFADDALLEQARIHEEVLGRPARALELYRTLVSRFSSSRLARRAQARIRFLGRHLDEGEEALREYMEIQRLGSDLPAKEVVARMERLLEAHPGFSLRPDGLYWMGTLLARSGKLTAARAKLQAVVRDHPHHRAAGLAWTLLGNLAMQEGDFDAAELAFTELGRLKGDEWKEASQEAHKRLSWERWKKRILASSLIVWSLALGFLWVLLIRRLRSGDIPVVQLKKPPPEAVIFILAMLALVVWAWTGTRQTCTALLWMTGMVLLLLLPNGWLLREQAPRGIRAGAWVLILVVVCLACVVASIELAGMTDQVLHTIRWGPE